MKIEIKNRWTGAVIFTADADSIKLAVMTAHKAGVSLRDSNLSGSDLRGSDLSGSDLRDSDLTPIRDDLWAVLSAAPREVRGLRQAIIEGRVNGSAYEGECACLVGTIANVRQCKYDALGALKPNANRPAEKFFLGIKKGDTPAKNQFAKLALAWIDEWLANVEGAFAEVKP